MNTVRSALERVKGVKKAEVSLDKGEAVVRFDPEVTSPGDLIKAVQASGRYDAKVRKKQNE